jgi:hypothetical protein
VWTLSIRVLTPLAAWIGGLGEGGFISWWQLGNRSKYLIGLTQPTSIGGLEPGLRQLTSDCDDVYQTKSDHNMLTSDHDNDQMDKWPWWCLPNGQVTTIMLNKMQARFNKWGRGFYNSVIANCSSYYPGGNKASKLRDMWIVSPNHMHTEPQCNLIPIIDTEHMVNQWLEWPPQHA